VQRTYHNDHLFCCSGVVSSAAGSGCVFERQGIEVTGTNVVDRVQSILNQAIGNAQTGFCITWQWMPLPNKEFPALLQRLQAKTHVPDAVIFNPGTYDFLYSLILSNGH